MSRKSDSGPFVSVLTPVFNAEKYLSECIESVLGQTYNNYEYIIVNNGSTDRTLEIAEGYAQRDSRIRVYDNEKFITGIQNHNRAISKMSRESKYCKFAQADDWLFPECIAHMVKLAEENPTVGLVSSYILRNNKVACDGLPVQTNIFSGRAICQLALRKEVLPFGTPTSVLIRSDVIRQYPRFFNETHIHADREACYEVLQHHDFGFVHQILSFTRLHDDTQTVRIARKHNTEYLEYLGMLKKYGPVFLQPEEYWRLQKKETKGYYRNLASYLFRRKDKKILKYHRTRLKELGFSFRYTRLAAVAAIMLLDKILRKTHEILIST